MLRHSHLAVREHQNDSLTCEWLNAQGVYLNGLLLLHKTDFLLIAILALTVGWLSEKGYKHQEKKLQKNRID